MMTSLRQFGRLVISFYLFSVSAAQVSNPGDGDLTLDEVLVKSYGSSRAADFIQSNNTLLVELDVILSPEQWARRNNNRDKRSGIIGDEWPNAVVPFKRIDRSEFSEKEVEIIRGAFAEYRRYTCVRFRSMKPRERGYLVFYDGGRCSSALGHQGTDQSVSLAKGCRTHGVVVHELMHALGVHHEQTRPDRDLYVRINENNIEKVTLFNFKKYGEFEVNSRGIPYDYLSIMHYGSGAFAKDNSKPAIITLDSRFKNRIGQRYGLSFEDIKLINLKYRCGASCPNTRCPEGAFLSQDCTCWCKRNVEFGEPVAVCDSGDRVPGGKPGGGFGTCGNKQKDSDCDWWKSQGYCEDNFASFMMSRCRETCGWCGEEHITGGTNIVAGTGTGTGTTGTDTETGGGLGSGKLKVCRNQNSNCLRMADAGLCEQNAEDMTKMCQRSCGKCGEGLLTAFVCKYQTLDLACDRDRVIRIVTAMYGRKSSRTCSRRGSATSTNTNCHAPDSLDKTKALCEGKIYCTIQANNDVYTNRCGTTPPYLQVQYTCVEKGSVTTTTTTTGGVCEDENPSCSVWAKLNFCSNAQHQPYMTRACRKSCELCGGASVITASCRDISPSCSGFKSRGDCETNPHWMSIYCKATCNTCRSGFGGARKGPCKDTNHDCEPWVKRGMCEDNKEYMGMNCAKACGYCK